MTPASPLPIIGRCSAASRSYVLAALRALHLDPCLRAGVIWQPRRSRHHQDQPYSSLHTFRGIPGRWQGAFRTGHLDAVALRYAIEVTGGIDAIALTHLDTAARHPLRLCRAYQIDGQLLQRITPGPAHDLHTQEQLTQRLLRATPVYQDPGGTWPEIAENILGAPVALTSHGPTAAGKKALAPALLPPAASPL